MKNNILVVGGTGFIGYHLANKLKKNNLVYSISTKKPSKKRNIKGIKYIYCDIYKKKILYKKLNKINFDYIINLGGHIDHSNKLKTKNSHYYGCKNLVNYFKKKKIKLFIQIGSSLEYGKHKSPHHEKIRCNPKAEYGRSKYNSTKYIIKTDKKKSFPFIILRLYQVYGPNQTIDRLIPIVISSCLKNKKFSCSPGTQIRDFLYVDDLVKLFELIILSKKKIKGIFNIGSGKPIQVKNVIETIKNKIKKGKPQYGEIKMRKDESKSNYPNLQKIFKLTSWRPKISLKNGLEKTIKFYR